jgi:hypothetical protein
MIRYLWALLAVFAFVLPAQAQTVTFSDTVELDGSGYYSVFDTRLPGDPGGVYRLDYSFDQVSHGSLIEFEVKHIYDWYDVPSGNWTGGNDEIVPQSHYNVPDTGQLLYVIPRNTDITEGDFREISTWYLQYTFFDFAFEPNSTLNYTFTVTYLGAVPEPGVWLTAILGFGLAGGVLRRRRDGGMSRLALA